MDSLIDKMKNLIQRKHVVMVRNADYLYALEPWLIEGRAFRPRFGNESDIPTMIELEQDGYQGYLAWTAADFLSDWRKNIYGVYIMLEDVTTGEVVGMITGRFQGKGAHISHLIVSSDYRGLGLGNKLLELWIDLVEREALPKITLEVRESNITAQRLYTKHGFIKEKTLPYYYYDNDETAFFLCRYSRGNA